MNELKKYYNGWKKRAWIPSLICWVFLIIIFYQMDILLSNILTIWADDPDISWIDSGNIEFIKYLINLIVGFVTPTSVTVFIYFGILDYINRKGWKRRFLQYDISGVWNDIMTYTKKLSSDGWEILNGESIPSPVIIEQTCQHIKIKNSVGDEFTWYSILVDWDDKGALEIFHRVEY